MKAEKKNIFLFISNLSFRYHFIYTYIRKRTVSCWPLNIHIIYWTLYLCTCVLLHHTRIHSHIRNMWVWSGIKTYLSLCCVYTHKTTHQFIAHVSFSKMQMAAVVIVRTLWYKFVQKKFFFFVFCVYNQHILKFIRNQNRQNMLDNFEKIVFKLHRLSV